MARKRSRPKKKKSTKRAKKGPGENVPFRGCQDIQNEVLRTGFYLSRVGVRGIKKPVRVNRPTGEVTLTPTIDIFVDLPARQKGSHMSRNAEVVNEIVDTGVRDPCSSLEGLCADLTKELLEKHDYATTAEVHMAADYFLERSSHSGKRSLEAYRIKAQAKAVRGPVGGIEIVKLIGVEVRGMTACPCAMESVRAIFEDEGVEIPKDIPFITHNQRNVASVSVQVPEDYEVEADDLITIIEESMSSPTFEILKRGDEAHLVLEAHENPKFVEDVVRDILTALLDKYKNLPDTVKVVVTSTAEESIHKHNAYAERVTTLGELRKSN
jgi:GTP cyclohydrolase-4